MKGPGLIKAGWRVGRWLAIGMKRMWVRRVAVVFILPPTWGTMRGVVP